MDVLTTVAASGMRARIEALDVLANNLANAGSAGFKADREFHQLYVGAEKPFGMPEATGPWTDFSQGAFTSTGNPLDLALSGPGMFVAEGPSGPVYTRNGSFRVASDGTLQTAEGYAVRAAGGGKLRLDPRKAVEISPEGRVSQDGIDAGALELLQYPATALAKTNGNYFQLTDASARAQPAQAQVLQGRLESANVNPAETSVRLIGVMRQFEMLQRAITLGGEMNRKAVEELGRVS
jgi:flagellar basal body rod protein FlgG